jgi:potassium efflux system protein
MFLYKFVRIACLIVLCILIHALVLAGESVAKESNANGNNTKQSLQIDEIAQEISRINGTLGVIRAVLSDQVYEEFGVRAEDVEKRLLDLGLLKSSYERLLTSLTALDKLEKNKLSIKDRYEDYRAKGMAVKPPYTLTLLDSAHGELASVQRNQKNMVLSMELLRQEVMAHNERFKTVKKNLRQKEEKLATAREAGKKNLIWQADTDRIQLRYLQTIVQAQENEILRYELENDLTALQIALLKEQTTYIKSNVAYDDEDLKHQLAAIQQKKDTLQKEDQRLNNEQKIIEEKWLSAQQDFENGQTENQRTIAEVYLKSRNEWRKTYQLALELNQKTMLLMDRQALAWTKRYSLIKGNTSIDLDKLEEIKEDVEKTIENLGQTLQIQQDYLINLQKQMSSIENRLGEEGILKPVQQHLSVHLDALGKQLERRLAYQSVILATDQIEKRLSSEIEGHMGKLTLKDHITDIKKDLLDFWNIEIWTVDNQPVTLRKVAIALIILLIGIITAKFMLSMFHTRFLLKSQFKETTAAAVHKLLSYTTYLLICLFALRMVNIPLTAFAFLGGAVAIGIGFGAQNLINNFISGFMILGERPINIGDLIEVESILGMVEEIGARCTRVRTGENIHILVPNSAFLEKNIINWTLSDKKIRTNIVVGVSYGSPVKKVREKLLLAAKQVHRVLASPEPFVLFNDFGDNALIFHVYFWVNINRVIERRQIESDVRFEIDDLFAQEGITIAFPQRDVHLDMNSPLKIMLEKKSLEDG